VSRACLIRFLAIALAGALMSSPAAAQITGSLNWTALGFADEAAITSGATQTSVDVVQTVAWSSATNGGSFVPYEGANFVSYESGTQGGFTGFAQMGFDNENEDPNDRVTLTVSYSEAVTDLEFTITDIDQNSWDDFIEVYYNTGSGFVNAKTGSFVASIGPTAAADNESFGDGWEGLSSAANSSTDGNIAFDFGALNIIAVRIVYFSGDDGSSNPGAQQLGVSNISFDKVMPSLSVSKTVIVSPLSASTYAIPGSDVLYTITAQNLGVGTVDTDAVFLVDRLPTQLTFYNADMDGGGPATGAVLFTQAAGTGLTFTPATDLRYSSAVAPPASFAACSYTPTSGYDPNVRHICLNPKGKMRGGTPIKSFSVQFRGQIK
jgi:uncharacterized repeat protein (TIGR01451 family)